MGKTSKSVSGRPKASRRPILKPSPLDISQNPVQKCLLTKTCFLRSPVTITDSNNTVPGVSGNRARYPQASMVAGPLRNQVMIRECSFGPISNGEGFKIGFRPAEGQPDADVETLPIRMSAKIRSKIVSLLKLVFLGVRPPYPTALTRSRECPGIGPGTHGHRARDPGAPGIVLDGNPRFRRRRGLFHAPPLVGSS